MTEMTQITLYAVVTIEYEPRFERKIGKFSKDRLRSVLANLEDASAVLGVYDEHGNRITGGDENVQSDALLDRQEIAVDRLVTALEKEDLIA